ncbi:aminoacyl-tRNA hydrolase [Micrococcales bacterium 31B]|nr:aminoacyl-tRNA hydrolase [Micrococcales bacterium 31B]
MTATWLVIGLGNPGPQYAQNRHNVGHHVLDELARRQSASFKAARRGNAVGFEGRFQFGGDKVVFAKTLSYMNVSGGPASALANFYHVTPDHVVVVHDELDIPFDTVKLKIGGGEGGHNGLRDITKALGTKDYYRVRVGIGRPPGRMEVSDFVLSNFSAAEKKAVPFLLDSSADAVEHLVTEGLLSAQQKFHVKG